ncbi:hypothetical protein D3C81_411190 [compost metagenome]
MARALDILLDQHVVVAERRGRLALAAGQRIDEVLAALDFAHALAAAAGAGLDQHRVADAVGLGAQELRRLLVAVVARRQRHAGLGHQGLGRALVAHRADRTGGRTDEGDPRRDAGVSEIGVLGEEAVAGMDGLRAGAACSIEDGITAQVALARGGGADVDGLVGQAHMACIAVRIGIHRHGGDAEATAGGDDAAGDLAAVGDQDFAEHGNRLGHGTGHMRNTPKRVCCGGALRLADRARASTRRVSTGSITPSSHRRALA